MFGQGSPKKWKLFVEWYRSPFARAVFSSLSVFLIFIASPLIGVAQENGTHSLENRMRIRFVWGGPNPESWIGKITVSDGEILSTRNLGVDGATGASTMLGKGEVQLLPVGQTGFNGIDIETNASADAHLYFELTAGDGRKYRKSLKIEEINQQPFQQRIDQGQNYVSVFRCPGDQIFIDWKRSHPIFQAGETLAPNVYFRQAGLNSNSKYRVDFSVRRLRDEKVVSSLSREYSTDDKGHLAPVTMPEFELPDQEGVYELMLRVSERKLRNFSRHQLTRKQDFVVLSSRKTEDRSNALWRSIAKIHPAESTKDIDPLNPSTILAKWQKSDFGNGKVSVFDKRWLQMDVGSWQVFPMEVDSLSKPHILEVEYQRVDQAVGISILQENAQGQFETLGADSGFFYRTDSMALPETNPKSPIATHRIPFWPKTRKIYVVIANRDRRNKARIGKLNLYAGPNRLNANDPTDLGKGTAKNRPTRGFLAYYEEPLFPENFATAKKHDPGLNQSVTDWRFFYQGTGRLIEYLKANEYRGAMITIAANGNSIFPSKSLRSGPKYDTGIFATDKPDGNRKDVVALMLKMFEREGLRFIPVLELSTALPELEYLEHRQLADDSLKYINIRKQHLAGGGANGKPSYNLLSPLVQREIQKVVSEVHLRYRNYESYGGLAIKLGPDTFTILPGQQWGFDQPTVKQFLASEKIDGQAIDHETAIQRITRGDLFPSWMQWRISQTTGFYRELSELVADQPNRKLYLSCVDLFRDKESRANLSPGVRKSMNYLASMRNKGLDPFELDKIDSLVMLRPQRVATGEPVSQGRIEFELNHSPQKQQVDHRIKRAGDLFVGRDQWVHYAQLQKMSPFSRHRGDLIRWQPLVLSEWQNRKRFSEALASGDSKLIGDGGQMLPLGQEKAMIEWRKAFNRLPNIPMTRVETKTPQPVVVRQIQHDGRHFFYIVNNSPWTATVTIEWNINQVFPASLNDAVLQDVTTSKGNKGTRVTVLPYGLVGGVTQSNREIRVENFSVVMDKKIVPRIQERISRLRVKIEELDRVKPMPAVGNSSFEQETESLRPPQWSFDLNRAIDVEVHRGNAVDGNQCLKLKSKKGVVWLRSRSFKPPETGRLTFAVWLRTEDPKKQPPLRISIQGKHLGSEYYRFANVGSLVPDGKQNQIESSWKRFAVHFDDLPSVGLENLQVGLDLMGEGEVWVDKVEVYDRWFDEVDRKALSQTISLAAYQLVNKGDWNGSRKLLSSYWPTFLETYIGEEEEQPSENPEKNSQANSMAPTIERSSSLFERVRFRFPNRVFKIR